MFSVTLNECFWIAQASGQIQKGKDCYKILDVLGRSSLFSDLPDFIMYMVATLPPMLFKLYFLSP